MKKFRTWIGERFSDEKESQNILFLGDGSIKQYVLNDNGGISFVSTPFYTVQFFTGKYDRNKKEIFEGDIVCDVISRQMIGEIVFSEERSMFQVVWHDKTSKLIRGKQEALFPNTEIVWEVIGNIFQNSEYIDIK